MKYKAYTSRNIKQIPQYNNLNKEQKLAIDVVSCVLPFKTNNYVVEKLIDWEKIPQDPIFLLNFPQVDMLTPEHFSTISDFLNGQLNGTPLDKIVEKIRRQLNPHPGKQIESNVPVMSGEELSGMQHKYKETILFFPNHGQTCHAYCTFCFRWPQFVGVKELRFASQQVNLLIEYVKKHPEISDILITGGDPMTMNTRLLTMYIKPIVDAQIPHLKSIRIGTKSLSFWPYRFTSDKDADELLRLFEFVKNSGLHLALMAHFNHPQEMNTEAVKVAIQRIQSSGAVIRTQSPLLRHINDQAKIWADMWQQQVKFDMIPYYMFVPRNTGAQQYFSVPLVEAWQIFQEAYSQISGICRTVRGPVMSTEPGKVEIVGIIDQFSRKAILLQFLQNRKPELVKIPFFAEYDPYATWFNELKPALGTEAVFLQQQAELLT